MRKKKNRILFGIVAVTVLLNILSWHSRGFADWMRRTVFYGIQYIQGHLSSLFPFSVGELLLILAVFLTVAAIVAAVVFLFAGRAESSGKSSLPDCTGSCKGSMPLKRRMGRYLYVFLWAGVLVCFVMTTNCFILYHCSSFGENYIPEAGREYTVRELALVREHAILECNALAQEMERDEAGNILWEGDMEGQAILEMERLGMQYPLLAGYYPDPKKLAFSSFFSQQYILGYYFPFTMEANYNGMMYIANVPVTLCHELSHVKGFIYEDDANFIGYLACVSSDDAFFRYSGYLSVIDYLNRDLYESLGNSRETYLTYVQCSPLVERDNVFLTKEAWKEVESRAVIDTETVKQASRSFLETNLQLNGVEEGIASYGEVVERLLEYYDGVLY